MDLDKNATKILNLNSNAVRRLLTVVTIACSTNLAAQPDYSDHDGHDHGYSHDSAPVQIGQTVITGTRTERLLSDVPVQTELYTPEDFDSFNITTLKDALALVPTARFESDCQNCGLNQIQLLGLSTEYTSILFDGAPLYSGLAKVYGADLFPAIFIDRIEIVKGGGSVLYGPEAIAGVVNLISDEPLSSSSELRGNIEYYDVGNEEEYETTFRTDYVDPEGLFSLSVYGLYQTRDGIDLTSDGFTEIPEFDNKVLGTGVWYHPSENSILQFNYQYLDEEHRGGDRLDLPEIESRVSEALEHEFHTLRLGWEQEVDDSFDYFINGSFSAIDRQSFYGARGAAELNAFIDSGGVVADPENLTPAEEAALAAYVANPANDAAIDAEANKVFGDTDNYVYYVEAQGNYQMGEHLLSAGVQYRFEVLEDSTPNNPAVVDSKDDFANIGFFVQDQWAINDAFELVPGIRVDKHDNVSDVIVSPRIAARYNANDNITLRTSYSTGFNAPGAFNEDEHIGVNTGGAIELRNDPNLEEEKSQTFSFGAEYRPTLEEGEMILLSQIHYTLIDGTFDIDDSNDPNWVRINGPDSEVFVWENSIDYQINANWRFNGSISYIYARFDEAVNRVTGLTTEEYVERPEITGLLGLNYENADLFDAYVLMNYTGSMLAVGEDADIFRDTPDFFEVDIGVSKNFVLTENVDLEVSVGVKNLFDERQDDLDNSGEDRDVTYFYGPTRPRSYYVSASIAF